MERKAKAVWHGTIKDGGGYLSTQSNTLNKTAYSFVSRFENGEVTNPEELMAAAHAGCFTMKLSLDLTMAGFVPGALTTECVISLVNGSITKSALTTIAQVPGITKAAFAEIANSAKENCPVSKAYAMEITLDATLSEE